MPVRPPPWPLLCALACAPVPASVAPTPAVRPTPPPQPTPIAAAPVPADMCPDDDETPNGYRDDDGCPDEQPVGRAYFSVGLRPVFFTAEPQPRTGTRRPESFFFNTGDVMTSEVYPHAAQGRFMTTRASPRSTLAAGHDVAAFPTLRRFLARGGLPPIGVLRIESMVDYFTSTQLRAFTERGALEIEAEVGPCPWNPRNRLARVRVEAPPVLPRQRTTILVLDRSASMSTPERLPLIKRGISVLLDDLAIVGSDDRVAVLAFDRQEQLVLPPTPISERAAIDAAIAAIRPGGESNNRARLDAAHAIADAARPGELVHIIVASDGANALWYPRERPARQRHHVSLTVIGVGERDLDDETLGSFAADNDGQLHHLDTVAEAQRTFHALALQGPVLARDVQFQAVFDPRTVARYHVIGQVNNILADDEFTRDRKVADDPPGPHHGRRRAGELAAGQARTILYELEPTGAAPVVFTFTVRARIDGRDRRISREVADAGTSLADTSSDFRFTAAVAELGLLIQGGPRGEASLAQVRALATGAAEDAQERAEFIAQLTLVEAHYAARAAHWAASDAWSRAHRPEDLAPALRAAAQIPASSLPLLRFEAMRMRGFGVSRYALVGLENSHEGGEQAGIAAARADAVKRYLVEVMGHAPEHYITSTSKTETVSPTAAERALDRRVDLEPIIPQ